MPPGTKKTSISLDPELESRAKERAESLGFKYSFSAYIAALIRDDIKAADRALELHDEKPPIKYAVPGRSKIPPGKRSIPKTKEN